MTTEKTKELYNGCVQALAVGAGLMFMRAFALMLAFGVIHHEFSESVPALGYWACMPLSLVWTAVINPAWYDKSK